MKSQETNPTRRTLAAVAAAAGAVTLAASITLGTLLGVVKMPSGEPAAPTATAAPGPVAPPSAASGPAAPPSAAAEPDAPPTATPEPAPDPAPDGFEPADDLLAQGNAHRRRERHHERRHEEEESEDD